MAWPKGVPRNPKKRAAAQRAIGSRSRRVAPAPPVPVPPQVHDVESDVPLDDMDTRGTLTTENFADSFGGTLEFARVRMETLNRRIDNDIAERARLGRMIDLVSDALVAPPQPMMASSGSSPGAIRR